MDDGHKGEDTLLTRKEFQQFQTGIKQQFQALRDALGLLCVDPKGNHGVKVHEQKKKAVAVDSSSDDDDFTEHVLHDEILRERERFSRIQDEKSTYRSSLRFAK